MVQSAIEDKDFQALNYITYKKWLHLKFEPVDIDHDGMGEGYDRWDDDVVKDLE